MPKAIKTRWIPPAERQPEPERTTIPGSALGRVTAALADAGLPLRHGKARCPAHDDPKGSLAVAQGRRGVMLKCHAGCLTRDVLDALGLSESGLFDDYAEAASVTHLNASPVTYEYGPFRKVRRPGKDFSISPAGAVAKVRAAQGRLPLYREELLKRATAGPVYVVEGEKDADTLAALGHVAVSGCDGGAKWEAVGQLFKDRHVVVVADRDGPGYRRAVLTRDDIAPHAYSVRVVRTTLVAKGADVSDHLAAGLALDGLEDVPEAVLDGQGELEPEEPDAITSELLSLQQAKDIPRPNYLVKGWINRRAFCRLFAPSGKGKSFIALDISISIARGAAFCGLRVKQAKVLYLWAEGQGGIGRRIEAWEKEHPGEALPGPDDMKILPRPVQVTGNAWALLVALVERERYGLVVIDTQARVTVGLKETSDEMSALVSAAEQLQAVGAAVLLVHHTPISSPDRARGHGSVKAALDLEIQVEEVGPHRFMLKIDKAKDDDGDLTMSGRLVRYVLGTDADGDEIASLAVRWQANPPNNAKVTTSRPLKPSERALVGVYEATSALGPGLAELTRKEIADSLGVRWRVGQSAAYEAVNRAVGSGLLEEVGRRFRLTQKGRDHIAALNQDKQDATDIPARNPEDPQRPGTGKPEKSEPEPEQPRLDLD